MNDVRKCSKCKTFSSKSNFYKDITKKMVIDQSVETALNNIVMIIEKKQTYI